MEASFEISHISTRHKHPLNQWDQQPPWGTIEEGGTVVSTDHGDTIPTEPTLIPSATQIGFRLGDCIYQQKVTVRICIVCRHKDEPVQHDAQRIRLMGFLLHSAKDTATKLDESPIVTVTFDPEEYNWLNEPYFVAYQQIDNQISREPLFDEIIDIPFTTPTAFPNVVGTTVQGGIPPDVYGNTTIDTEKESTNLFATKIVTISTLFHNLKKTYPDANNDNYPDKTFYIWAVPLIKQAHITTKYRAATQVIYTDAPINPGDYKIRDDYETIIKTNSDI